MNRSGRVNLIFKSKITTLGYLYTANFEHITALKIFRKIAKIDLALVTCYK